MAARDRIAKLYPDTELDEPELARSLEQSQDVLLEMLSQRFERAIDALLRNMLGSESDRLTMLDALFDLYEEGLLTKGDVRRRSGLKPEDFYDELRAYRLRHASR